MQVIALKRDHNHCAERTPEDLPTTAATVAMFNGVQDQRHKREQRPTRVPN